MPPRKRAAAKKTAAPKKVEQTAADPAFEKVTVDATQAGEDLEEMVLRLEEMKTRYSEPAEHKKKREELRNDVAKILEAEGPRYFLDHDGNKRFVWVTVPETVNLDIDRLIEMDENGDVPYDLLDKVAPRKVDRAGLSSAIASGALTSEQVKEIATVVHQTPRVYTKSAESGDDQAS